MTWRNKVAGWSVGAVAWFAFSTVPLVWAGPPSTASASEAGCEMGGTVTMPARVAIHAAADTSSPIGRFTGAPSALSVLRSPAGSDRMAVQTGSGRGSFRLTGYVASAELPVVTTAPVVVVDGHLWIVGGQEVRVAGAERGRLRVEKRLRRPIDQTFTAWAPCGSLGLGVESPPESHVAGNALGYVVKGPAVELYDQWGAGQKLVTLLRRSSNGPGLLLFSTERRGSWVRVEYSGAVRIDAWARARDLEALPPGEIMDSAPSVTLQSRRVLRLAKQGREVRSTSEVPIRLEPHANAPVVGVIEADTDTTVVHEAAGTWLSVLPRSMNVAPYGDGNFWVLRSELEPGRGGSTQTGR